jgi:integrase
MATLERNGKGWRVVWRENSTRRKSKTYCGKIEASRAMRQIEAHLAATKPYEAGTALSWADLIARYVTTRVTRTTQAHRDKLAKVLTALAQSRGWTHASDPTPDQTAALRPYEARVVRALLRFAGTHCQQRISPAALAACRSPSPRRRPVDLLNPDQVAAIQDAADKWHPNDGAIVHLVATYGHRIESLLKLTRADYDGSRLTLHLKSGDQHRHPLLSETRARFDALPGGGPPIHTGHLARPWRSGAEFATWALHSLGTGILPLRRYAITRLLDHANGDARTVASITGHRTPSLLLNTYARTNEDRQTKLMAALMANPVTPK